MATCFVCSTVVLHYTRWFRNNSRALSIDSTVLDCCLRKITELPAPEAQMNWTYAIYALGPSLDTSHHGRASAVATPSSVSLNSKRTSICLASTFLYYSRDWKFNHTLICFPKYSHMIQTSVIETRISHKISLELRETNQRT